VFGAGISVFRAGIICVKGMEHIKQQVNRKEERGREGGREINLASYYGS
jgi:hypothetical protein